MVCVEAVVAIGVTGQTYDFFSFATLLKWVFLYFLHLLEYYNFNLAGIVILVHFHADGGVLVHVAE